MKKRQEKIQSLLLTILAPLVLILVVNILSWTKFSHADLSRGAFLELIIISGIAIPVVLICQRLKIPVVVGLLLAGVLINPHLGIVQFIEEERVHVLADFGVACLLFSVGLEFSFKRIKEMKTSLFIGGTSQVFLTVILVALLSYFMVSKSITDSIFLGCVISASCTALFFSHVQNKGEMSMEYARISTAILIFQDLISIVFILFFPLLAGGSVEGGFAKLTLSLVIKLLQLGGIAFVFYKWIIPKGMYYVAKTQSRELFIMAVFFVFLFFLALSAYLDVSIAMGAFLAGIIIAESPYNHRSMGVILPFKDIFMSIFFVSIGIMLDLKFVFTHLFAVALVTFLIMSIKFFSAFLAVTFLKRPLSVAIMTGASLCQVGEFSFVMLQAGNQFMVANGQTVTFLLTASVLSIIITPFIMNGTPSFARSFMKLLYSMGLKIQEPVIEDLEKGLDEHVVIVGYGIIGRRVALGARMAGLQYCVIEANPDTVKKETEKGVSIFYGDASQEAVLEHAKVEKAKIVAVTIPNHEAAVMITESVRRMNPSTELLVRTRFEASSAEIIAMGASHSFVEEKEISIEMLAMILKLSFVSMQDIENILTTQAEEDTDFLEESSALEKIKSLKNKNEITVITIDPSSELVNRSLSEVDFRRKYGMSVIMIRRDEEESLNPSPDEKLRAKDSLVVVGARSHLPELVNTCRGKTKVPDGLPAVISRILPTSDDAVIENENEPESPK